MRSILATPYLVRLPATFLFFLFAVLASTSFAQSLPEINRLMKQGQLQQALSGVDSLISSKPKDAEARFVKGLILTDMGKSAEAIKLFTKMTEDFPELPEPYNNLAVLYAQQKQYDKARGALEMAIRTHPSYSIAHENLGDVYAKLASQAYDKALQNDSSNANTQTKLALIKELPSNSGKQNASQDVKPTVKPVAPIVIAKVEPEKAPPPALPAKTVEKTKTDNTASKPQQKPSIGSEAQVVAALQAWARAWSNKDVKAYLGFYASNFQTPKSMSRKQWESERAQRINKPGKLQVSVGDIKVTIDGDKATARFRQQYSSSSLKTGANKTIVFIHAGGRWQILQERVN